MGLTEFAVKRPVGMCVIIAMFVVLGLYSYRMIGVDLFPSINIPYVTVISTYPGAGAEEIETQILKPIESSLATLSKVKKITSQSNEGLGFVVLEFDLTANADQAALDVQKKIDSIKGTLPEDASDPVVSKIDLNAFPVMTLAVKSPRPLHETYYYADKIVKESLQKLSGVADVSLDGGQDRVIKVKLDKNRLAGYGLSVNSVTSRLGVENLNQPSGRLDQPEAEYNVRVMGEFKSADDIKNIQIPLGNGKSVYLRDVATVEDTYKDVRQYSRLNGDPSIGVNILKQSDASTVDVGKVIKRELPNIQKALPPDFEIVVNIDSSKFITDSLNGTLLTIIEGIFTTAFILFFFLREWRSMVTVLIAIPTSLVSTLMGMYFAGFSFNMMSLMGMALCIGILVDDSIVVLENIHRHRAMGKSALQAALEGRSEVGMAAIAITMSDVVVFAPIAFMGGMIGQYFRQFGLTVVIATLFSLFVSFTLAPMLAHRFYMEEDAETRELKAKARRHTLWGWLGSRVQKLFDRFWSFLDRKTSGTLVWYDRALKWSLGNRKKVLVLAIVGFILSLTLIPLGKVGFELMPQTDQSTLTVTMETPIGTPLQKTESALRQIEDYIKKIPEVKYYQASVGSSGGYGSYSSGANKGQVIITLYDKSERDRSVWQVGDEVRKLADSFPYGKITVSESDSMGGGTESDFQIEVAGPDYTQLVALAEQVKQLVAETPGAKDVDMNYRLGQPEVQIRIDRQRAGSYGLSVNDVANTLRTALNGSTATVLRTGDKDVDVDVSIEGLDKTEMESLKHLTIATTSGIQLPLSQVAEVVKGSGPTQINRVNRQRTITVSGNIGGTNQGAFSQEVGKKLARLQLQPGYSVKQAGQTQDMNDIMGDMLAAFALAIVLVYMVLAILYESLITPLIRMFSLPLGLIGSLIALALTHNTLNLFSMIGVIMMDGLVAKNGTLLIDYTNTLRDRGVELREAVQQAAKTRLRPIIMTSVTMIFGMLPTALALTEGTEIRSGMAVVLIGGLITSTLFTLIVIPVFYTVVDDYNKRRKQKKMDKLRRLSEAAEARV
ncbi:efflux RND transporter permease subunit [Pelotomaculum propionicicum]|uniref:Multidrug resistance protein MdtB n=1 Tax=Pelotomaculum propionicicum TaxID=258475 RepID=A0A4Y7RT48_9FIRM|nr:efflux RND transporter permease subunit [Pelotomaculum propionicicum]TEB12194.1 Multidrug resistance protein MdtB [Pelotomaculum propionicicum]